MPNGDEKYNLGVEIGKIQTGVYHLNEKIDRLIVITERQETQINQNKEDITVAKEMSKGRNMLLRDVGIVVAIISSVTGSLKSLVTHILR